MFQELVSLYSDCCALDSNLLKRLQFWSHELRASTPHLKTKSEKISALSDFVFEKLFLSPNPRHTIVDWGQAMQERKCHPLMLAVLYGHFGEAADLDCTILSDYSFRYVKFAEEGIFDLHNEGNPVSGSQLLECMKSNCGAKSFEPLTSPDLKKSLFNEILKGHFSKGNWEQVITTLSHREKAKLGSPRDFTTYAYVYEKMGRKEEALIYLKRFFSFVPDQALPHLDQIQSILSKLEFRPFEN